MTGEGQPLPQNPPVRAWPPRRNRAPGPHVRCVCEVSVCALNQKPRARLCTCLMLNVHTATRGEEMFTQEQEGAPRQVWMSSTASCTIPLTMLLLHSRLSAYHHDSSPGLPTFCFVASPHLLVSSHGQPAFPPGFWTAPLCLARSRFARAK